MLVKDLREYQDIGPEMSDEEFEQLKRDIETVMRQLAALQKQYRRQTGQDYRPY